MFHVHAEEMKDERKKRIPFNRQLGVCEKDDTTYLQAFNNQVIDEITRLTNEDNQPKVKKVKLSPLENFDCNANFALEL